MACWWNSRAPLRQCNAPSNYSRPWPPPLTIVQTNIKRMLAYSSIAHAGYILVAFAASTAVGVAAVLFYLAAYVLMKVGAFLVVTHLG